MHQSYKYFFKYLAIIIGNKNIHGLKYIVIFDNVSFFNPFCTNIRLSTDCIGV